MADTKISDLTNDATPTSDDLIVTVNDPGGTPANRKVTLANLGSNGAWVDTGGLADSSVIPAKLLAGTGSTYVWQDWSPTYGNITVGNGTVVAKYTQIGKTVHFRYSLVCGSTTSLGNSATISLPVTAISDYGTANLETPIGQVVGHDAGSSLRYFGPITLTASATVFTLRWHLDGVNYSSGTFPFAETTNDTITIVGTYEAA